MTRSEEQWRSVILSGPSNGNQISGRVYKGGKFWVAKLPALDVMTQGRTKIEACGMVKDMLEDEERRTEAFSTSQDALSMLAVEARADIKAGGATQLVPNKL